MNFFLEKNKNILFLCLLFIIVECIIDPRGEFALNDDWAYAKSVEIYYKKGFFDLGYWPAMTLYAHVLWGLLFVKIFGFSFTVLRASVLVLSLITVLTTYKLAYNITGHKRYALVASLLLFVTPLFINLSNSYMTDVSFLCFVVLSVYFFQRHFYSKKYLYIFLGFVFCTVALFVRQLAICIPLAFLAILLIDSIYNRAFIKYFLFSVLLFSISLVLLYYFEKNIYLKYEYTTYQGMFFSKSKIEISYSTYFVNFYTRLGALLLYTGLLLFPVLVFKIKYIVAHIRAVNPYAKLIMCLIIGVVFIAYPDFPIGNVLYNIGLGLETTVDTFHFKTSLAHGQGFVLFELLRVCSLIGSILFLLFVFIKSSMTRDAIYFNAAKQFRFFVLIVLVLYLGLFSFFDSFYDRYSLSFSFFALLLIFNKNDFVISHPNKVRVVICVIGVFSILATKDYFNYNRLKENIVSDLIDSKKCTYDDIHGGLEYMMWHYYDKSGWDRYWNYRGYKYEIAFGDGLNYYKIASYPYRRYIPYKMDTLFILERYAE